MAFLNENAFATPKWAARQRHPAPHRTLRRHQPRGNAQRSVLNNLLSSARFARLVEQEALDGSAAYPGRFPGGRAARRVA